MHTDNQSSSEYHFKVLSGKVITPDLLLYKGKITIGRHPSNAICFADSEKLVSKKHVIVTINDDSIKVTDCGSTNGTFCNGTPISAKKIAVGDVLRFGEKGPELQLCGFSKKTTVQGKKNESNAILSCVKNKSDLQPEAPSSLPNQIHAEKNRLIDNTPQVNSSLDVPLPMINDEVRGTGREREASVVSTRDVADLVFKYANGEKNTVDTEIRLKQKDLIKKFAKIHKVYCKKRNCFLGTVVTILMLIAGWFAYSSYTRGKLLKEVMTIKKDSSVLNTTLDRLVVSGAREKEVTALMDSLRQKNRRLDSIMSRLPRGYQRRYFEDPVEEYLFTIMDDFGESNYAVPPHMLKAVRHFIAIYSNDKKKATIEGFRRKHRYFPYFTQVFTEYTLPNWLMYIPMVESNLDPHAQSHAGACGMWQFMKETACDYGLKVNSTVDERTDWQKSTVAAARYLHHLIVQFGDGRSVLLAIAAYNCGEQRMAAALEKMDDIISQRDFWYLYGRRLLPKETREYVPRILARMIIDMYPGEFGFSESEIK